jgi:hypothetical protein
MSWSVKRDLVYFILSQESLTKSWRGSLELSAIRTLPPPPCGSEGAVRGIFILLVDVLRKAKNRNWPNYNSYFCTRLFRKLGKYTTYRTSSLFWNSLI